MDGEKDVGGWMKHWTGNRDRMLLCFALLTFVSCIPAPEKKLRLSQLILLRPTLIAHPPAFAICLVLC